MNAGHLTFEDGGINLENTEKIFVLINVLFLKHF
jgi:hypothetical protein